MMKIFVLLASFLAVTQAHDWYSGECPVLTPLSEFSMERVSIIAKRFTERDFIQKVEKV